MKHVVLLKGLKGDKGAVAVDDYYDQLISSPEMMIEIDALNMNVSDHFNGYGMMDGQIIPNVWGQYDLVRKNLTKQDTNQKRFYPPNHGLYGTDRTIIMM